MLFESLQITRVDHELNPNQTFSILSVETLFESIGVLIDRTRLDTRQESRGRLGSGRHEKTARDSKKLGTDVSAPKN